MSDTYTQHKQIRVVNVTKNENDNNASAHLNWILFRLILFWASNLCCCARETSSLYESNEVKRATNNGWQTTTLWCVKCEKPSFILDKLIFYSNFHFFQKLLQIIANDDQRAYIKIGEFLAFFHQTERVICNGVIKAWINYKICKWTICCTMQNWMGTFNWKLDKIIIE